MAPITEGDEIFRPVIGRVAVMVMNVEVILCTAEPASVAVTCQNDLPELFPFLQSVFIPHGYKNGMALAKESASVAFGIGTGIAEAPVGVSGHVPAGRSASGMKGKDTALEFNCLFCPGHIWYDRVPGASF